MRLFREWVKVEKQRAQRTELWKTTPFREVGEKRKVLAEKTENDRLLRYKGPQESVGSWNPSEANALRMRQWPNVLNMLIGEVMWKLEIDHWI